MSETVELTSPVERDAAAVPCPCGGYAEAVEPTPQEAEKYDQCGRYAVARLNCCGRAFVCRVCGNRLVGSAEAPEME